MNENLPHRDVMGKARIAILALSHLLLSCALIGAAQEVVFKNGSRLAGIVERYADGFAYIRLFKESGKTVLTTMPESAVDKTATQQAQAAVSGAVETGGEASTGPFKLPHNDSTRREPGIAAVAAEERDRRMEAMDSGAATGRVFENGQRAAGIPTGSQIEALANLTDQPKALPDMDAAARVAGLRFYEVRLEALSSAFAALGDEWEDMWRYCTPITFQSDAQTSKAPENPSNNFRPHASYREAVIKSFRRVKTTDRWVDNWSISCVRRNSDSIARGKQVVEVYDVVFEAYADFATNTDQSSQAVARALPTNSR